MVYKTKLCCKVRSKIRYSVCVLSRWSYRNEDLEGWLFRLVSDDDKLDILFFRRQVWAFGYCHCLCLCVRINHELVRAETHYPFKLGSSSLDQRYKNGGDRPWPSMSNLTWRWNCSSLWACLYHYSLAFQTTITQFGPQITIWPVKILINWLTLISNVNIKFETFFIHLFATFYIMISETRRLRT